MARRPPPSPGSYPAVATVRFEGGASIAQEGGDVRRGDPVEATVGDDLLGVSTLQPERPGGPLVAEVELRDVPPLAFPARLRIMNRRSGAEFGAGLVLSDTTALLAAAGPPTVAATFAGQHPTGPGFSVAIDRLGRYPRGFALRVDGATLAEAVSVPGFAGAAHGVTFTAAPPPDAPYQVVEAMFGVVALAGRFDAAQALAGAQAQLARLEAEVAALRDADAQLRRRLDTALDLGRERLLLERLDLFYLLLSERIERAGGTRLPPPPEAAAMQPVQRFGPAEIDGIGLFDVETDGSNEWRWLGPDATLALRDIGGPVRRVVLYFHGFGDAVEPPVVRVSTGGPAEAVPVRALEGRYALDVPVSPGLPALGGLLVVHLSFDRHQTSVADPRLLSAVFSGAEIILATP